MAEPAVKRGEVLAWMSLAEPPEGYRFAPGPTGLSHCPATIIALRDHAERPVLSEEFLAKIERRPDRQMELVRPDRRTGDGPVV